MTPRVWVRLMGTGGAANEGRHQACLLVGSGDSAAEDLVLLDTGGGLDVVRQLVAAGYSPTAVRDIFVSHQHLDHLGGLEPLLLWSVIRSLRERGGPPKEETRVYCEPRVLRDPGSNPIEPPLDSIDFFASGFRDSLDQAVADGTFHSRLRTEI